MSKAISVADKLCSRQRAGDLASATWSLRFCTRGISNVTKYSTIHKEWVGGEENPLAHTSVTALQTGIGVFGNKTFVSAMIGERRMQPGVTAMRVEEKTH